jgi:hypothetical protein
MAALVIPAQAGIHFDFDGLKMDSRSPRAVRGRE